jgi:hypothetical protein
MASVVRRFSHGSFRNRLPGALEIRQGEISLPAAAQASRVRGRTVAIRPSSVQPWRFQTLLLGRATVQRAKAGLPALRRLPVPWREAPLVDGEQRLRATARSVDYGLV